MPVESMSILATVKTTFVIWNLKCIDFSQQRSRSANESEQSQKAWTYAERELTSKAKLFLLDL